MRNDSAVRQRLVNLLTKRQAYMSFADAVADFPAAHINTRPTNVPYTFWHLLEHLCIAQWDILDYIQNPDYQYRPWPEGYWPDPQAEADEAAWKQTIAQFAGDLQALVDIVNDPQTDLYAQIPHGEPGHNILREMNVVASHNAYHIGELAILRQVMGLWPPQPGG
jgi:hypothetical protein